MAISMSVDDMSLPKPTERHGSGERVTDETLGALVCWTRMQAEAGQDLRTILSRKDMERRAGEGLFFWGVGNAAPRSLGEVVRSNKRVDVVFSVMKSKPRQVDVSPSSIFVWRKFFDLDGLEREIPEHVLVTSRGDVQGKPKTRHYALVCFSSQKLELTDGEIFDPSQYRNAGLNGGVIGVSQVTALVKRCSATKRESSYRVNLRAQLVENYWVRLSDPKKVDPQKMSMSSGIHGTRRTDWCELVKELRGECCSLVPKSTQLTLI